MLRKGQGLLELTIALGIVMTGVMAALSLSLSNTQFSRQSENRVIASNLAREGVEAARFKREGGWVANPSNTSFLPTFPAAGTYALSFDPQQTDPQLAWTFVALDATLADPFQDTKTIFRQLKQPSACNDLMIQGFSDSDLTPRCSIAVNLWRPTVFRRVVELQALTCDTSGTCGSTTIGYRVRSTVQWSTGALKKQTITVEDLLYDWKK